jgi:hypothetical protein
MHLMHKVGGITHAQGTPGVYIVLPAIDLLVVLEGEIIALVLGFDE